MSQTSEIIVPVLRPVKSSIIDAESWVCEECLRTNVRNACTGYGSSCPMEIITRLEKRRGRNDR